MMVLRPWPTAIVLGSFAAIHAAMRSVAWLDAAFVPFRYADRIVEGGGHGFGAAPLVEGVLNPLWAAVLIGISALNIDVVRFVPWLSVVGFGLWVGICTHALCERKRGMESMPLLLLLCGFAPLVVGAKTGTDVVILGLLSTVAFLGVRWSGLWLALLSLTGVPGAVLAVGLSLWRRKGRWAVVGALAGLCMVRLALGLPLVPNAVSTLAFGGVGRVEDGLQSVLGMALLAPMGTILCLVGVFRGFGTPGMGPALLTVLVWAGWQVGLGEDGLTTALIPAAGAMAWIGAMALPEKRLWLLCLALLGVLALDGPRGHAAVVVETKVRALAHADSRAMARFLNWRFEPGDRVAVHRPGVVPYYTHTEVIDLTGQTDPAIAGVAPADPATTGHPFRFDVEHAVAQDPVAFLTPSHLLWDSPQRILQPGWFPPSVKARYMQHAIHVNKAWRVSARNPVWVNIYIRRDLPMLRPEISVEEGNRFPAADLPDQECSSSTDGDPDAACG